MRKTHSAKAHFSRAASVYDEKADVQREVAQKLLGHLCTEIQPESILELGCGTGFLTRELLKAFPEARIDAVDLSLSMIERAKSFSEAQGRVAWHVADGREFSPSKDYDLICSSSSFQWMQPLEELFQRFSNFLLPGGILLFSLMVEGTLAELREMRREVSPAKALMVRLPSVSDVTESLRKTGFSLRSILEERIETRYRDSSEFLNSLKELGFTGGALSASSRPLQRGELERLKECYEARYALPQGGVRATYCVVYVGATL